MVSGYEIGVLRDEIAELKVKVKQLQTALDEALRTNAELMRVNSEQKRINAELIKVNAEQIKVNAEQKKTIEEQIKVNEEQKKTIEEQEKTIKNLKLIANNISAEVNRIAGELDRLEKELTQQEREIGEYELKLEKEADEGIRNLIIAKIESLKQVKEETNSKIIVLREELEKRSQNIIAPLYYLYENEQWFKNDPFVIEYIEKYKGKLGVVFSQLSRHFTKSGLKSEQIKDVKYGQIKAFNPQEIRNHLLKIATNHKNGDSVSV